MKEYTLTTKRGTASFDTINEAKSFLSSCDYYDFQYAQTYNLHLMINEELCAIYAIEATSEKELPNGKTERTIKIFKIRDYRKF